MKTEHLKELKSIINKKPAEAVSIIHSIIEENLLNRNYDMVALSYVILAKCVRKTLINIDDEEVKKRLKQDVRRFLELSQIYALMPKQDLEILFSIYENLFIEKIDSDYDIRAVVLGLEGIAKKLKKPVYKEAVKKAVQIAMNYVNDLSDEDIKRLVNV